MESGGGGSESRYEKNRYSLSLSPNGAQSWPHPPVGGPRGELDARTQSIRVIANGAFSARLSLSLSLSLLFFSRK